MVKPSKRFQVLVIVFMVMGLVVHGVAFLLFTVDIRPRVRPSRDQAYVDFFAPTKSVKGSALEEAMVLFDSEPLFLPHPMNFGGELDLSTRRWEPESALLDPFPPNIVMSETGLEDLQLKTESLTNPKSLLRGFGRDYWSSFGELKSRDAIGTGPVLVYLNVKTMGRGETLGFELFPESLPDVEGSPLEGARFMVYLGDRDGFAEPFLVKGCGNEAYDLFFRDLIVKEMPEKLLGYRGYFEVTVGL